MESSTSYSDSYKANFTLNTYTKEDFESTLAIHPYFKDLFNSCPEGSVNETTNESTGEIAVFSTDNLLLGFYHLYKKDLVNAGDIFRKYKEA